MSRPNSVKLGAFLAALLVLSALAVWLKGALYISQFEGDALHLADIVIRMADGERPHRDFMTPIGALAFWPIVLFLELGLPLGHAVVFGQTLFALAVAPVLWWAAATRLPPVTAFVFAGITLLILTSLAHSYDSANTSISLHYNRWGWGLAFIATLLVALPNRQAPTPRIDGVLVALLMAAAAMVKATYVAAFAPVLVAIALIRGERAMLVSGLVAGAVAGGLLAALLGPGWFLAYYADLRAVQDAPLRDAPGLSLHALLVSPVYLAPTLTLFAAAFLLRRRGRRADGLAVLLLLPAFLFVTWQNFDNEPTWLVLLAALLAATFDSDRERLQPVAAGAAAAALLAVPILVVHGLSAPRHLLLDRENYVELVPGRPEMADVLMPNRPAHLVRAQIELQEPGGPFATLAERLEAPAEPLVVAGETLAYCRLSTGLKGTMELIAGDLGPDETPYLVADILSSYWLYGGRPVAGAPPWNYGTLHGIEGARHIVVPLCPMSTAARRAVLEAIQERGTELRLVRKTHAYLLVEIVR